MSAQADKCFVALHDMRSGRIICKGTDILETNEQSIIFIISIIEPCLGIVQHISHEFIKN